MTTSARAIKTKYIAITNLIPNRTVRAKPSNAEIAEDSILTKTVSKTVLHTARNVIIVAKSDILQNIVYLSKNK